MTAVRVDVARELIAWHLDEIDALWALLGAAEPDVYQRRPSGVLTAQERRVARAYAVSSTPLAAVVRSLHISVNTAKTHLRHAYAKLGVDRRRDLRLALLAAERVPAGDGS
jgi:DNA-binding CsgD family transcriptional regulator